MLQLRFYCECFLRKSSAALNWSQKVETQVLEIDHIHLAPKGSRSLHKQSFAVCQAPSFWMLRSKKYIDKLQIHCDISYYIVHIRIHSKTKNKLVNAWLKYFINYLNPYCNIPKCRSIRYLNRWWQYFIYLLWFFIKIKFIV